MTCIAGLVHNGDVYIGGDSAGIGGLALTIRADEKVFHAGPFLIGFCGSFRMGNLLRYSLEVPAHPAGMDDHRYLCTLGIDAIRDCLKKGGMAEKKNEAEWGGRFLLGYRGHLYYVDNDYQVGQLRDAYAAIGCGGDLAQGALFANAGVKNPIKRVRTALQAAERHSGGVRGPFYVKTQVGTL